MRNQKAAANSAFKITDVSNIPNGRKGKHHAIVTSILEDLGNLQEGKALKIPIAELPDTVVNIRSALSRATRKLGKEVPTATDENFLYIWNGSPAPQENRHNADARHSDAVR